MEFIEDGLTEEPAISTYQFPVLGVLDFHYAIGQRLVGAGSGWIQRHAVAVKRTYGVARSNDRYAARKLDGMFCM